MEHKIKDVLRKGSGEITVRFDPNDTITLPSQLNYSNDEMRRPEYTAKLLRKVEVLERGTWKPYPSVSWIDGEGNAELYTVALVRLCDDSVGIMESPGGMPDGKLMLEAEKAGIHTIKIT